MSSELAKRVHSLPGQEAEYRFSGFIPTNGPPVRDRFLGHKWLIGSRHPLIQSLSRGSGPPLTLFWWNSNSNFDQKKETNKQLFVRYRLNTVN